MAKTRVASAGRTPKSSAEIKRDAAIKKHAKYPDRMEEIERIIWEFQKRVLSGEILDLPAALQQLSRKLERIGVRIPRPPKDRPKTDPTVKTCAPHRVGGTSKVRSVMKKGKKSDSKRHQASKRPIKK
jgi:hypothetical protein